MGYLAIMFRRATTTALTAALLSAALPAAAQEPETLTCDDMRAVPGLVWMGSERLMTLQQLASYAAPLFWLSPDEPTMNRADGLDIRVPAALPFESQPESPVVYYQFEYISDRPDRDGPGYLPEEASKAGSLVDLRNVSAIEIQYIAYFPDEEGIGEHRHDVEPTEIRLLVARSNGPLAAQAGYVCDEEFYLVVVLRATGEAHGNVWYYNILNIDAETTLPIHLLVEEGKHGIATDKNGDGYFTPGYDVNARVNDAWGVRDTIRSGRLFSGKFEAYMAKVRQPEHRVLPPLPADSLVIDELEQRAEAGVENAVYELRPYPSSEFAAGDDLLMQKMREKEYEGWPALYQPVFLTREVTEWITSDLEMRPFSVSFRYDGVPGLSVAFPLLVVKNVHEPMTGGYLVHRLYFQDEGFRDLGWMVMYTPSASRWFDEYFAAGIETDRYDGEDGTLLKKRDFVLEMGFKFRFKAPVRTFGVLPAFWGFRFGVKNVGKFEIESLSYVIEIGAGVW